MNTLTKSFYKLLALSAASMVAAFGVIMVLQKLPPRVLNIFEYWSLGAASALSIFFAWCGSHTSTTTYQPVPMSPRFGCPAI